MCVAMAKKHGGRCPYCDSEMKHLNNHVRMSTGEHGSQGSYPEDWDKSDRVRIEPPQSKPSTTSAEDVENGDGAAGASSTPSEPEGSDGQTVRGLEEDDDQDDAPVALEFADDPADAREYECGNCSTEIEYLDAECPECGQSNAWQGVEA